jgi:ABC-2 type transport system permease protein
LIALGEGRWLEGIGLLTLSLGLASLVFALALSTAERLYYSGWAGMQSNQRKKKASRAARPVAGARQGTGAARLIPSPVRAIVVKDAFVLSRDLRNMSQLVTPLILGIVYAMMFLRSGGTPPAGRGEAPGWFMEVLKNLMVYGNVGISLFVGWMLIARLGGMGISQEGKSYWLLKTAPVSSGQILAAKFGVTFLPPLILGWAFLLVITLLQRASPASLLFTFPVVALCVAGNAGLNLAFGVMGANLNWEDPRQMQRGTSGCLGSLASVFYLLVSMAFFFAPPVLFGALGWSETAGQLAGILLGGSLSLACAVIPLRLVHKRVLALGEE